MNRKELFDLAMKIKQGMVPDIEIYKSLTVIPDSQAFNLFAGADMIRDFHSEREIHFCMICNGKSGKCSENCIFCAQSANSNTDAPVYPLLEKESLKKGGLYASNRPINRYSIVTSGKGLSSEEVVRVAKAMSELDLNKISTCVSLGILGPDDFVVLKKAGVTRYHHNLETARSHFNNICTTHTYDQRLETIKSAKAAGLSICSGGVFGIGESSDQILELALELKELDVDAVPINFLTPVKGTPAENYKRLSPLQCLKIISIFRYVLPDKDILVCGGREANLKQLAPLIFYAGANGIMTGDYLTTTGQSLEKDMGMIKNLEFTIKSCDPLS